jgi:exonuclease VII small subunit
MADKVELSLEQKLLRLQEIQLLLEQKKVNLSQSMPLLEEAFRLKQEIEKELSEMENKLITLSQSNNENDQNN